MERGQGQLFRGQGQVFWPRGRGLNEDLTSLVIAWTQQITFLQEALIQNLKKLNNICIFYEIVINCWNWLPDSVDFIAHCPAHVLVLLLLLCYRLHLLSILLHKYYDEDNYRKKHA